MSEEEIKELGPKDLANALEAIEALAVVGDDVDHLHLIGSGSVIPWIDGSSDLTKSRDLDFVCDNLPMTAVGNAALGVGSEFAKEHLFYVQLVQGWTMAKLPKGWEDRGMEVTPGEKIRVLALHPHDLAWNKLLACRSKDLEFVASMCEDGLVDFEELVTFLGEAEQDPEVTNMVRYHFMVVPVILSQGDPELQEEFLGLNELSSEEAETAKNLLQAFNESGETLLALDVLDALPESHVAQLHPGKWTEISRSPKRLSKGLKI